MSSSAACVLMGAGLVFALASCSDDESSSPGQGAAGSSSGGGNPSSTGGNAAGRGGATAGAPSGGSSGAAGSSGSAGGVTVPDEDAPSTERTFSESDEVFVNPERGFYATTNLVEAPDLGELRESGVSLVHTYVRLDDYRTRDIPASLLTQATAGFARAREAGVKIILRFAYNFGPYPNSEPDAPKEWVLKHIEQVKPLLEANSDVIAVVQAGFIGAWGEWHTSTNGLTEPATRKEILEALVDAVPTSRSVQLRYPPYKKALYGEPLAEMAAFGTSYAARVGHHNDCFVSSDNDVGTYPDDEVDVYRDYVAADTLYLPMGGETCALSPPRSECASALAEMAKLHFSYINREFHEGVLSSWSGCMTEMQQRLGYRLRAVKARLPERVKPGGSFALRVELTNDGFAAPFNAKTVSIVLRGDGVREEAVLKDVEVRRWLGAKAFEARLRLPSSLAPGSYSLALRLSDPAPTLSERPEYCVRLANGEVWEEATGDNVLTSFEVAADAPGTTSEAVSFEVLAEQAAL